VRFFVPVSWKHREPIFETIDVVHGSFELLDFDSGLMDQRFCLFNLALKPFQFNFITHNCLAAITAAGTVPVSKLLSLLLILIIQSKCQ
jgi:hypothetical protein